MSQFHNTLRSLSWTPSVDLSDDQLSALHSALPTPAGSVSIDVVELERVLSRDNPKHLSSFQTNKLTWLRAAVEYLIHTSNVSAVTVKLDNISSQDITIREGLISLSRYGSYPRPLYVETIFTKENLDYAHHCYLATHLGDLKPRTLEVRKDSFPYGKGSILVLHIKHKNIETGGTPWGRIHRSVLIELLSDPDINGDFHYRTLPLTCTVEESVQDFAQLPLPSRLQFLDIVAFDNRLPGSYEGTLNLLDCGVDLNMHFEPFLLTRLDDFHRELTLVTTEEGLVRKHLTDVEKTHWILRQRGIHFNEERYFQDYEMPEDGMPWDNIGCKPDKKLFLDLVREAEDFHMSDFTSLEEEDFKPQCFVPSKEDSDGFDVY